MVDVVVYLAIVPAAAAVAVFTVLTLCPWFEVLLLFCFLGFASWLLG